MIPDPYTQYHNKTLQVTQPAAGADWSVTVPANEQWVVGCARFQLAAASGGSSRTPVLSVVDASGNVVYQAGAPTAVAASSTVTLTLGDGSQNQASAGSSQVLTFPDDYHLGPGFQIVMTTGNLGASDQWSAINFVITELDNA